MTQDATNAATDTATIEVPAQHHDMLSRVATLLREAESDIVDNVEAGIAYLEQLWSERKAINDRISGDE